MTEKTPITDAEVEQIDKELAEEWKNTKPLAKVGLVLYAIFLVLTTALVILYVLGIREYPPSAFVVVGAYLPAALYFFVEYLKQELYYIVGAAAKDALAELIEELEEQLPTQEDQDRLEALLDEETKGSA